MSKRQSPETFFHDFYISNRLFIKHMNAMIISDNDSIALTLYSPIEGSQNSFLVTDSIKHTTCTGKTNQIKGNASHSLHGDQIFVQ